MIDVIRIDAAAHQVWKGQEPLRLRPTPYRMLVCLAGRAGTVVSRAELVRAVWGSEAGANAKTVHAQVSLLRQAIGDPGDRPVYIVSVTGVGYRFTKGLAEITGAEPDAEQQEALGLAQTLHAALAELNERVGERAAELAAHRVAAAEARADSRIAAVDWVAASEARFQRDLERANGVIEALRERVRQLEERLGSGDGQAEAAL
ncbi:winged helix-turn-helix domain-containing protein [Planomonospora corallina]|uniref:Winged helix-turn-helix domain-containing protein n=1 Tax=Planomonospora corallina TaxID=1806052 RepID=A0ABV8IFQ2_9ACTN